LVGDLHAQDKLAGFDLGTTVFNFMLPRRTVLNDNPAPGATQGNHETRHRRGVPDEDEADSLHGLGGYHGSIQTGGTTIYYAVGVYSETSNSRTNGIPVFDAPWKNVVATFYRAERGAHRSGCESGDQRRKSVTARLGLAAGPRMRGFPGVRSESLDPGVPRGPRRGRRHRTRAVPVLQLCPWSGRARRHAATTG
jgi:hypothetical protein